MKVGKNTKIWHPEFSNIGDCEIGDDCVIHSHVWIGDGVKIGNRVKIQAFTFIPPGVVIEDGVFIGPRVTFTNDKHAPSETLAKTIVRKGASIGAGAIILPVVIDEWAVVGAGAVVTKWVLPGTVVVGNPAKILPKAVERKEEIPYNL